MTYNFIWMTSDVFRMYPVHILAQIPADWLELFAVLSVAANVLRDITANYGTVDSTILKSIILLISIQAYCQLIIMPALCSVYDIRRLNAECRPVCYHKTEHISASDIISCSAAMMSSALRPAVQR